MYEKILKTYEKTLKELEYISQSAGIPVDYTQGGGGNTSAKLDGELMAVKASGFKLKQINSREGYVVVNYKNIRHFYENVDLSLDRDYEKEFTELVKSSVVEMEGPRKLRPSVEAGFHSILKKYVIHTHSVYANILCCAGNGREMAGKIFNGKEYEVAWVPYINPGFSLSLRINEAVKSKINSCGRFPEVILMENHGLIVTSDESRKCVELQKDVNNAIKEYVGISEAFPVIELFRVDDNTIISKTEYLKDFFKNSDITADFFDETVLYPDQLVYLNGNISVNRLDNKLNINTNSGEIIYKTSFSEAETFEETLLAYVYVLNGIRGRGMPLKTMSEKEISFIRNWESEAYRRRLASEKQ